MINKIAFVQSLYAKPKISFKSKEDKLNPANLKIFVTEKNPYREDDKTLIWSAITSEKASEIKENGMKTNEKNGSVPCLKIIEIEGQSYAKWDISPSKKHSKISDKINGQIAYDTWKSHYKTDKKP
jgi:hypothetical protein